MIIRSDNSNALAALLYDIDWVSLQALTTRPIILQHLETGTPIYAVLAEPPENVAEPPSWHNAALGLKVAIPPMSPESILAFESTFEKIGASIIILPFTEIYLATERGLGSRPIKFRDSHLV